MPLTVVVQQHKSQQVALLSQRDRACFVSVSSLASIVQNAKQTFAVNYIGHRFTAAHN